MSDKHPCNDLTPNEDCNKTCCPEYVPDSDWCKAFNKRTLEQLKETTRVSIDGMWFNIEDAKNTIGQAEQYLAIIYELLVASLDQVMKVSASAARTEGDFESASVKVKEYVGEIHSLVGGAQYNGRHLLQDTTNPIRSRADIESEYNTYNIVPTFFGDQDYTEYDNIIEQALLDDPTTNEVDIPITDVAVYGDNSERNSIHFRLAGPRGACRNVGNVFNDFVYELPKVGVHSLGLTAWTSKTAKDYYKTGLDTWSSNEGVVGPDDANQDDVDDTVSDFNCAIKKVGVELDKLRSYRYTLCLREKQVRIYEAGQNKCFEDKITF